MCLKSLFMPATRAARRFRETVPFLFTLPWPLAQTSAPLPTPSPSTVNVACARYIHYTLQLTFGRSYKQCVDSVEWPRGIEQLVFGQFFFSNHVPLHSVAWPKGCVVRAAGSTMCRS